MPGLWSFDVAMLEVGEDEGRLSYARDLARAGGDMLEGAPALGEQGEPAFAEAAQGTLDGVAGAGVDIKVPAVWGLFDRDEDLRCRRPRTSTR